MTMPNFLIIGAAKCGTTALYRYLGQHPQVFFSSIKEPHFFSFGDQDPTTHGPGDSIPSAITNLKEYQALFKDVSDERAIGEASPTYIYVLRACERIRHHIPDAKLIAILRQPAERAYSAFMHVVRDGREPLVDFSEALKEEPTRIEQGWGPIWHYKQGGLYYEQLKRYYDTFSHDQIRVYLYEDFGSNHISVLQDIFGFLGVAEDFVPDVSIRPNVSGIPKNRTLRALILALFMKPNVIRTLSRLLIPEPTRWRFTTIVRNMNLVKTRLAPEIRQQLTEDCREDILKLQGLIQKDLSHWLQ